MMPVVGQPAHYLVNPNGLSHFWAMRLCMVSAEIRKRGTKLIA